MFRLNSKNSQARKIISVALTIFLSVLMLPVVSSVPRPTHAATKAEIANKQDPAPQLPNVPMIPAGSAYRQTNFVSDIPGLAFVQDPVLINPWGIAFRGTSPFWVANNGTSSSSLFRGDVSGSPLVKNPGLSLVTVPGLLPTGVVGNSTTDFAITPCSVASCPAAFIFASITGNIVGWNPSAGPNSTTGVIAASHPGHVYTGLANGVIGVSTQRLYAADFANGNIDVFDGTYALTTTTGNFADPTVPATYHPHNIQNIGGSLYVTYALPGPDGFQVPGVGNGFVRRFDTDGVRDLTFGINNGPLNAPWGVAIAPPTFGIFGSALLIGNFGAGNPSIHAFNPTTGAFLGTIQNEAGDGIRIPGLWALIFGNGVNGGDPGTLYFSAGFAGLRNEDHGLFGSLKPTTTSATSLIQFSTDEFIINEGTGHIDVSVTRAGDASGSATVNFNTFDEALPGHASQKSDYEIALGKISFAPGETAKTVRILIVNDLLVEGNETVNLALSNPTGTGVGLGTPTQAELTIVDNDSVAPTTNPIDDSTFFVRQHYLDFLNREPDAAGLAFWVDQIESCGADAACREIRRINVSAAFFLSIEFQKTGLAAYLTHRAAFGNLSPTLAASVPVFYGTFERDTQALGKDYIVGQPGADAQLEANKVAFFNDFVTRPQFVDKYPSTLTNAQYVDNLLSTAGLSPGNFVVSMTNGQENPPANPTLTGGARRPASFGTATFSMNPAQTQMTFTATVNNIDFTGSQSADINDNLTAAHIHAGASVTPTTNGPVVWGFFGTPFNDNLPPDVVNSPFSSGVGGTISGKWDAPEGNSTTFAAQLANLKEGRAYINFHTTQFGGGEVRGQFPAMTQLRDPLVAGLDGATETRATVLRKVAEFAFLKDREFNNAFVFMEYAGYLRRDADSPGFNFWLTKLNEFNGNFVNAEMVKAFISSIEYRQRFGPA